MKLNAATDRKHLFPLFCILSGVFLTAGCGMFRTSESAKEFEARKKEMKNSSQPDPIRQQQMRAELDKLRCAAPDPQTETQEETIARHGPPTKTELDALRKRIPTNWRTTPFGSAYYYLTGIPMYLFYNPPVGP